MDKARIFSNGDESIIVSAEEVLSGKYPRDSEFVDVEYPEYKVEFVKAGKPAHDQEVGIPYFRLYYSYEEYKKLYPDRADKYKIVADMRHYQESQWHRGWKEKLTSFCEIEKTFNFEKRWKFADAYDPKTDTCIEFQYSYANSEFEDRNGFYNALNKNMVWLFYLPRAQVREAYDGTLELLEDNAKGFFRVAYETQNKFKNIGVFIQTKSNHIYRVTELLRREGQMKEHMATLRYFNRNGIWTEDEWIEELRQGKLLNQEVNLNQQPNSQGNLKCIKPPVNQDKSEIPDSQDQIELHTIQELWKQDYRLLCLYNSQNETLIYIYGDRNNPGEIMRDYKYGCILFKYAENLHGDFYHISKVDEGARIWEYRSAKLIDEEWLSKTRDNEQEQRQLENLKQQELAEQQRLEREQRQRIEAEEAAKKQAELEEQRRIEKEKAQLQKYEELKQSIIPYIDQQEKMVKDSEGNRWVKCDFCGKIAMENEFGIYGGSGTINRGTCRECERNNPKVKIRFKAQSDRPKVIKYDSSLCPVCGSRLESKFGPYGRYLKCSKIGCRYTRSVK